MTPTTTDNLIPAPQVIHGRYNRDERTLDRWLKDEEAWFPSSNLH